MRLYFLAGACISLRWVTVFVLRLPRRSRRSGGETEPDDENEEKSDYFCRRIFYYRVIEAQIGCQRVSLGDTAKKKQKTEKQMEAGMCGRLQITPRRRSLGTRAAVLPQQSPVFTGELFLGQLGRFLPCFYTSEMSDSGAHVQGTHSHLWFFTSAVIPTLQGSW